MDLDFINRSLEDDDVQQVFRNMKLHKKYRKMEEK